MNLFMTKMGYLAIQGRTAMKRSHSPRRRGLTSFLWTCNCRMLTESTQPRCLNRIENLSHSRRGAYRMDVSARRGKRFESGYCNLLDKTGLAPNVKGDHQGIY